MKPWLVCAAIGLAAGFAPVPQSSQLPHRPTVVSLNPCSDAILAEILPPDRLLAISHYSHDPAGTSMDLPLARRFRATGGTVEEVLALDPDLVVGSTFMPPAPRSALASLGIHLETVGIATSAQEAQTQVRTLANAVGEPERGEALAQRMALAAATLARRADRPQKSTVLWQPGGIVPGEATLISDLMRRAGFASHSAIRGMKQAEYLALEQVLADPPELLLIAGAERAQHHPALRRLPNTVIASFDPSLLYCGGPTVIRAAARLEQLQ